MGKKHKKPAKRKYTMLEKNVFSPFRGNPNSLVNQPKSGGHGPVVNISVEDYVEESPVQKSPIDYEKDKQILSEFVEEDFLSDTPESLPELSDAVSGFELSEVVNSGSENDLLYIWKNKEELIETREDAALLLAALRFSQGVDSMKKQVSDYIDHDLVSTFPLSRQGVKTGAPVHTQSDMGKQRVVAEITRREGQQKFRKDLIEHYGAVCMVTGVQVDAVLEAAHISPYDGRRSNSVSNGLVLRSDIHRLFDAYLLGINPQSYTLVLSDCIKESMYSDIDGRKILVSSVEDISTESLNLRWNLFVNRQKS